MSALATMPDLSPVKSIPNPTPAAPIPFPVAASASKAAMVAIEDGSALVDKADFITVRFGLLGNTRKVSGADVLDTDADKGLLKVQKTLLDSPELEAIRKADSRMRGWLYNTCLPWDTGIMLLPKGLTETVNDRLTEYKAERAGLVSAFLAAYASLCANASLHLGSLWSAKDYPAVAEVASKFVFTWRIVGFHVPENLPAAIFQAEKEKAVAQMAEVTEEITILMRQTVLEMTTHLRDKLTPGPDGKPRIFRDTTVTNLQEFLSTFNLRNITNDAELAAVVEKAKALIAGRTAHHLRSSTAFREKIRSGMDGIAAQLSSLVETQHARKFRIHD